MVYAFPPDWPNVANLLQFLERKTEFERRCYLRREYGRRRFLYKYRSLVPDDAQSADRLRDVLVRSRIWLSCVLDFNDPFDMAAKIEAVGTQQEKQARIEGILKAQGIRFKRRRQMLPKFMARSNDDIAAEGENAHRRLVENAGICSFAGDPRSILMWSHYGDHHRGVCLRFDIAKDYRTFLHALSMDYCKEYPVLNWMTGLKKVLGTSLLRKHVGWSYEQESRIIWPDCARKYLRFEPSALCAVIVGCRAAPETVRCLESLLSERAKAGMPSVDVYQAERHPARYRLVLRRAPNK